MSSRPIMKKDGNSGRYKVIDTLKTPDSIHIIADFSGCLPELLNFGAKGEEILAQTITESGLHCIAIKSHQFAPSGYTAAALLTESHITLHTWPEHNAVQLDVFTCGSHSNAQKAYEFLKKIFAPSKVSEQIFFRNLNEIIQKQK